MKGHCVSDIDYTAKNSENILEKNLSFSLKLGTHFDKKKFGEKDKKNLTVFPSVHLFLLKLN